MLKLNADQLSALGAPTGGGAVQIEDWLRNLLRTGTIHVEKGVFELRGPDPVVTTLGDLRKACGVAGETAKQGLRSLEMDHWILLVDGAHTRLLGPPRFRVAVTKENFWGSVGQSIEVSVTDGLSPLETIDYDRLRQGTAVADRKQILAIDPVTLSWSANVKAPRQQDLVLQPNERFTLAAGSHLRESGQAAILRTDAAVVFDGGRQVRLDQDGEFTRDQGDPFALPPNSVVQLERSSLIRTANGQTGLLEISLEAALPNRQIVDWTRDSHWLSRFRNGLPLVLLRRAIFAQLDNVVAENCAGVGAEPSTVWRVVLGFHDCFLDGTIPYRAGKCSLARAPSHLIEFLSQLTPADSFRKSMAREYGFTVGAADVRTSPASFASNYDRDLLRSIATNPGTNSELLSLGPRIPCWTQAGAYHRKGEVWPWEITREIYFTHVDVHFRQQSSTPA